MEKPIDNWFVKLVAHSRKEPAISETVYYNRDFKCQQLFRWMWLFDRYAALVTLARPDLYVEKVVGNIDHYDEEEYCNKIRTGKTAAAKRRVTRIEREGFVPDLFGDNERRFKDRLADAQKALAMWEGDDWRASVSLPVRYINTIKSFKLKSYDKERRTSKRTVNPGSREHAERNGLQGGVCCDPRTEGHHDNRRGNERAAETGNGAGAKGRLGR